MVTAATKEKAKGKKKAAKTKTVKPQPVDTAATVTPSNNVLYDSEATREKVLVCCQWQWARTICTEL